MADKRVAKIVNTRGGVAAAGAPLQCGSQELKCVLNATSRRGSPIVENEECFGVGGKRFPIAPLCVTSQRLRDGGVYRNPALFAARPLAA